MTPTELADALDRQIMPHDSDDPCEDCDTLRQASHALRRLGSATEGLVADCETVLSARAAKGMTLPHELDGVPTSTLQHIRRTLRAALRAE